MNKKEVKEFIIRGLNSGFAKEEIIKSMEKSGWSKKEILNLFSEIDNKLGKKTDITLPTFKEAKLPFTQEQKIKKQYTEYKSQTLPQQIINNIVYDINNVKKELSKVIVSQGTVIDSFLRAIISNGHVLMEGVPGLAKTLIIKSLALATGCEFKRIQFTVDLLPADILGFTAYNKERGFYTIKGPIFANFIIADEINRATPKTQSSLLEAMQEQQVTIGKDTFKLPYPFFVMANNNPIESAGVYPLPEAQIDRFLFKILISYPNKEEEQLILNQNITIKRLEDYNIKPKLNPQKILDMQNIVKKIYIKPSIEKYIVNIIDATRHPNDYKIKLGSYIEYGASPRASIGLFIASKADALLQGKNYVTPQNVKNVAYDVLRHRILINYEGQAENIKQESIITEILSKLPIP